MASLWLSLTVPTQPSHTTHVLALCSPRPWPARSNEALTPPHCLLLAPFARYDSLPFAPHITAPMFMLSVIVGSITLWLVTKLLDPRPYYYNVRMVGGVRRSAHSHLLHQAARELTRPVNARAHARAHAHAHAPPSPTPPELPPPRHTSPTSTRPHPQSGKLGSLEKKSVFVCPKTGAYVPPKKTDA